MIIVEVRLNDGRRYRVRVAHLGRFVEQPVRYRHAVRFAKFVWTEADDEVHLWKKPPYTPIYQQLRNSGQPRLTHVPKDWVRV